ncbi:MAG: hypothetical protein WCC86_04205 [Methanoregula sp.]|uniref:hypothetical protein n=1 Tax=Methanoregula sp. TaxID=2052170 RepID=UPI003BAF295A
MSEPSEFDELKVFDVLLDDHVNLSKICNVHCKFLWSEWVRAYPRQTFRFPKLIREKEFSAIITGK